MNTDDDHPNLAEGHRQRLRRRYLTEPEGLSQADLLELLLMVAIPRRDVRPLAKTLLEKFGGLNGVFSAPVSELLQAAGIGESTAIFLSVIKTAAQAIESDPMKPSRSDPSRNAQLQLFSHEDPPSSETSASSEAAQDPQPRAMRVFANDEIANSLEVLPKASGFSDLEAFQKYLAANLPYNAEATRVRRAAIILERFYPQRRLDTPLTYYASHCSSAADLKAAVFYHVLRAEPIAARLAEELIWPALPIGRVDREQMREFILRYLPQASLSSQANMLRSLFYTYDLCAAGQVVDTTLRFNLRAGTLDGFLYVLTSETSQPGIYTFESLFGGPLHRWLLWDREWMRRQLYNLRDLEIVAKIAEIDAVRQFTLAIDQTEALRRYFEQPKPANFALRDRSTPNETIQGGENAA